MVQLDTLKTKIFLLALISFGYGAATIITIYIVTSLVSIISGAQTLDTSALIALLTEMLKSNFDLNADQFFCQALPTTFWDQYFDWFQDPMRSRDCDVFVSKDDSKSFYS